MRKTLDDDPRRALGGRRDPRSGRARWVFGAFALFGAVLLALEHRVHLLGVLPWLILLACPLMHLFMHRGHGHRPREPNEEGPR